MTEPVPMTAAAPEPPTMSGFARIGGVLLSPVRTFADIARRPSWLLPMVILIVLAIVSNLIMLPKVDWEGQIAERMEKLKAERGISMSEEQIQKQVEMTKKFAPVGSVVGTLIIVPLVSLLIALIYFAIIRIGKGGIGYAAAFGVVCWASLPMTLKFIISTVAALARTEMTQAEMQALVPSNPGFFVTPEQVGMFAYTCFQYLDVFSIWGMVLAVIGLSAASTWSRGKCAAAVIGLNLVAMVAFASLAAAFAGMM